MENSALPILCFKAGPGSDIWMRGTARLMNPLRQLGQSTANLMISMVCRAATTLVVVLKAAMILPALSLA